MGQADSDNAGGSGNTGGGGGSSSGGSSGGGRGGRGESAGSTARADRNSREGKGGQAPRGADPAMGGLGGGSSSGGQRGESVGSTARADRNVSQGKGGQAPRGADPAMGRPGGMNGVSAIAGDTVSEDDGMLSGMLDAIGSLFGDDDVTTADSIRSLRDLDKQITQSQLSKSILGDEDASLENAINAETEAGGFAQIAAAAATSFGGFLGFGVGEVGKALSRANKASNEIGDLNTTVGMTMDDSFSSSMATQARGLGANSVVGALASNTLGPLGAKIGKYGGVAGGLLGSKMGDEAGNVAMRDMPSTPSTNPVGLGQSVTGGRGQNTPGNTPSNPADIASTTPAQTAGKMSGFAGGYDYGIDTNRGFNAYGSYATRFFG